MKLLTVSLLMALCCTSAIAQSASVSGNDQQTNLWSLAKAKATIHRYSTLFSPEDIRNRLSRPDGMEAVVRWCKLTGVTKAYLETFTGGHEVDRGAMEHAKQHLQAAGIEVSGAIATTGVGKPSRHGWGSGGCYTDQPTQKKLQQRFEFAASLFDEIMIDDFWFTECQCSECDAARREKTVTIGDHKYSVPDDTWEGYRAELMVRLSHDRILGPAKRVNPKVRLILKYPQWYDEYQDRGYQVLRETAAFDRIWVGTETRDYRGPHAGIMGGTPQYEGYFVMRWLGGIGGPKCGGGWFDPFYTTEKNYIEQARQTVLAGAAESMLFCYGALQRQTGPKNVESLRRHIPELLAVAEEVRQRSIIGVAAYKPVNSHPENEKWIFDNLGMLGIPLVPCHEFPADAKAAFFSVHALKDPRLKQKLSQFIASGRSALVTDGLVRRLGGTVDLTLANVTVLPVKGDPPLLLQMPQHELDPLRTAVLQPLGHSFQAPNRTALYLFADGSSVIENFNDASVNVVIDGRSHTIGGRDWLLQWKAK